jgi:hypothetical protein
MTRLARAAALIAVFAGGYAILMLINGQLTDFDISAVGCAAALLGATLFEYVVRLSRKTHSESAGRFATLTSGTRHAATLRNGLSLEELASRQRLVAQQVNLRQQVYVAQPDSLIPKLAAGRPT